MGVVVGAVRPLLLDTVAFLLWRSDNPRLSARAKAAMLDSLHRPIYVSVVSAFEISIKVRLGKLSVPAVILNDFVYAVESDGFRVLELDAASAIGAGQIRGDHRDPFDRLLAAQAASLGGAIVTNDLMFVTMGVEVFW